MATTAEDVWQILAEVTTKQAKLAVAQKETDRQLKENSLQHQETDGQLKERQKAIDR